MTGHQLSILPGDDDGQEPEPRAETRRRFGPPKVPVTPIATSGRTEYTASCPRCSAVHRHTRPGPRQGPCGARYTVPEHDETE
ncbi:hypothetical protein [Streptomyces sp. NPDC058665]|uniref:hypothetical protein n=1 Tax=Streptomyces sp. NPDC058665 TaxID=3346586 RepID=UPI0036573B18